MNGLFVRLLGVCAGVWFGLNGAAQPASGVYREVYLNIAGSSIPNLTNAATYPNSPSTDDVVVAYFEAPANWAESYGTRMRALITPPGNGDYTFWISSDDNSELWLSTDATPANRRLVARVTQWTSTREWTKETNQQSAPITLVGGQQYYIEALMKEGTGGDNLAVRWQLPGGAWETADANAPIPGTRLKPYGLSAPQFATQPTNVTVVEGSIVTFSASLVRVAGSGLQWRRNGSFQYGATNGTFSIGPVYLTDSGSYVSCTATNWIGTNITPNAILTVIADTTRPTISGVANLGNNQLVTVVFSEDVEAQSATNYTNYAIDQGVSVVSAVAGPDGRTVMLTTTPMSPSGTYTLTVNNVRDRASSPNAILPNSQKQFRLAPVPLPIAMLKPQPEPLGPSTRKGPLVISEIMYHPTNRADGKNVEFIEVYNTMPWFEELGGFKITGAVEYTFPSNFVLGARSFVVIAKVPADVQAVYGTTGVLGPWTGSLQNSSGSLRLRNHLGAVIFETEYRGDAPWPLAADGAGHSLVLARPSYGEADPRAWGASDVVGGTPGTNELLGANVYAAVMINEILANTDLPEVDYVELFNYSTNSISLYGCVLTDDPTTNKFVFPAGTTIPAGGFIVVSETNLNFGLSSSGEELYFKNPTGSRVLDCVRFGPQENGVPLGRFPDGAQSWSRLSAKTPGTNNASLLLSSVVINEIMYHPASDTDDDEYIELFNPNTNAVDVSGWRLDGAVKFTIPANTTIPARGFLVVADNAARLRTIYFPPLTTANCVGDWSGKLNNSSERIALLKPVTKLSTNGAVVTTNTLRVTVDEVTYGSAGRWGKWSDGGGSSLELRDWRSEHRAPPSWADSSESGKSPWINIENTTTLANGNGTTHQLHITLMGAGECLIDNVEVIFSGANQVTNWTFEGGTTDWTFQGNHNETSWEVNEGYNSSRSLHIRATGRGDTGANRIRVPLPGTLNNGSVVTLRAKVRWLKGNPNILLRIRGNGTELAAATRAASTLGTPGAANTAFTTNAPPAITGVTHWPPLPAQSQPVTVTARVSDPDGIATLLVRYRVDPSATYSSLVMSNNGAGMFSAVIPPQGTNVVAFYVVAVDRFNALSTFPNDAPNRECVVMFGDTTIPGTLPTYRFWLTRATIDRWINEEKMSNKAKDVTFVYGTNRVIYNAGAWFHGSPYHSPGYDSPVGNGCDYDLSFPGDDTLLGETDINLYRPGNGGGDGTGQHEIHAYWFGYQLGTPFLFHRPVFVMVNGQRRDVIFHDAQQPNGDFGRQWYPGDADGELHKIQLGFEFGDTATGANEVGYAAAGANFGRYTYPDGSWHVPRYRQTLPLRSASPTQQNDYTNLYGLITAVNTANPINTEAYTVTLTNMTDVEEWYRVAVVQHLFENTDSFAYGGGQNAFIYKPARSNWKMLLWDVDFAFGSAGTDTGLFNIGGADHGPRNDHAPFARIYWQVLLDAANSILTQARSFPILDARYNGMVAAGAAVGSPSPMKTYIDGKRALVLSNLTTVACPWTITTSNGADFSIGTNYVTLAGTAPIDVRSIEINGFTYPLRWTSITNWTLTLALGSGTNTLSIVGRDKSGAVFGASSNTIRVNVTVPVARAEDSIVINEIMHNPRVANAEYVELFNRSTNTSFDLAGWRLNGVDYTFPGSAVLGPRQYFVLVKDRIAYTNAYGASAPSFDVYSGALQGNGELLTLIKPGPTTNSDVVIDKVRYDNSAPWPIAANNTGSSLQLADADEDNSRVGNWRAAYKPAVTTPATSIPERTNAGWRFISVTNAFGSNNRLMIYPDQAASVNFDDFYLTTNGAPETGKNFISGGDFETALTTNWSIGTNLLAYTTNSLSHSGAQSGFFLWTNSGSSSLTNKDLVQLIPSPLPANGQPCVLSFWYYVTNTSPVNYTVRLIGSTINFTTNLYVYYQPSNYIPPQIITPEVVSLSPGAANTLATNLPPFASVWINEVQSDNLTGIRDSASEREPWIEIYNAGTNAVSLDGLYLADNYTNLTQWLIPTGVVIAPRQFKLIFVDGQTNQGSVAEPHAPFRLASGSGSIALTRITTGLTQVVDYVNYTMGPDHSFGSFPDGQPFDRQEFFYVTPNATNNGTLPPIAVFINEWMADNVTTLADPADGDFEDWFEIYNPGSNTVSLAGYYLSDSLTNKTQFLVPAGYTIGPGGHLLVWADSESGQNNASRPDLHVNFNLAKGGDTIALFTPDGIQVDAVVFGTQVTDVSRGRFPDGTTSFYSMTNPTPRAANFYPLPNTPPTLAPITDLTVLEGSLVSFTATATDSNIPAQQLTFALNSAPANATIDPVSGNFVWQTGELDGGRTNLVIVRVTDNGTPPLSATQSFLIAVIESNTPPHLASVANQSVTAGDLLTFTASATDSDNPPQSLTYLLDASAPAGAEIDPASGVFSWTPSNAQAPAVYQVTIRARDNGSPQLEDSVVVTITVNEAAQTAPQFEPLSVTNGVVVLPWQSVAGKTYRLESKNSLETNWTTVTNIVANSATTVVTDEIGTNVMRFYRVGLLP